MDLLDFYISLAGPRKKSMQKEWDLFMSSFAPTFLQNYCLEQAVQHFLVLGLSFYVIDADGFVGRFLQWPIDPLRKDISLLYSPHPYLHPRVGCNWLFGSAMMVVDLPQNVLCRMNNQRTHCIARELCSVLCGSLDGRGVWGRMHTCMCMAESLCCSPETITTLLIGYTPIQNKRGLKKDGAR